MADEIDIANNIEIYNNLCKIYGNEDIDSIIEFSKNNPRSIKLNAEASESFGKKSWYVLEQLSLMDGK